MAGGLAQAHWVASEDWRLCIWCIATQSVRCTGTAKGKSESHSTSLVPPSPQHPLLHSHMFLTGQWKSRPQPANSPHLRNTQGSPKINFIKTHLEQKLCKLIFDLISERHLSGLWSMHDSILPMFFFLQQLMVIFSLLFSLCAENKNKTLDIKCIYLMDFCAAYSGASVFFSILPSILGPLANLST